MPCYELHPFNESDPLCCGSDRYDILYEISEGALPQGLSLDQNTGLIYGTSFETEDKLFLFTVKFTLTNKTNPIDITTLYKEYFIDGRSLKAPRILTTSLLNNKACLNKDYSEYISIADGTQPFTYSIINGILPYGLVLNPSAPQILGVPAKTGIYDFTFRVTDANMLYAEQRYTIEIVDCAGFSGVYPSYMSEFVTVKDNFHQKYLYSYIPTSLKDFKDS